MTDDKKPFRIGILGGMGPAAGVELHRLIVEATPAATDQDHLQVVLFTNPSIPDRTESLRDNDGRAFAKAAGLSVQELEKTGVDVILLACMTAHSRIQAIQAATRVPILSGIPLVYTALSLHYPKSRVALLATPGSIRSGVYTENSGTIDWLIPESSVQDRVTEAIYRIKASDKDAGREILISAMRALQSQGADAFILGCTELGLLNDDLQDEDFRVIDPMRLMASQAVLLGELFKTPNPHAHKPVSAEPHI